MRMRCAVIHQNGHHIKISLKNSYTFNDASYTTPLSSLKFDKEVQLVTVQLHLNVLWLKHFKYSRYFLFVWFLAIHMLKHTRNGKL